MVQEVVDGRRECGQLGPDAGAEVACRGPEFGSGSVRPLDEGSGSAVSDHSVHRLVRWAAGRVTSAEVSCCRALIDRLKLTWGHAAISHGGGGGSVGKRGLYRRAIPAACQASHLTSRQPVTDSRR